MPPPRLPDVHNCGVMVNPGLVTGQLKGAIAMGIGTALWEELTYDVEGRLTSDRFKTYLLPRSTDLPPIRVGHMSTPSPFHPLGMKGAGESGLGVPWPRCSTRSATRSAPRRHAWTRCRQRRRD